MSTEQTFMEQLDDLLESYRKLLKLCYDALEEDADQELRDGLRRQIESFVAKSSD